MEAGTQPIAAAVKLDGISSIYLGRLYVFSLIWSVGAYLEREDRSAFDGHMRRNFASLPLPPKGNCDEDTIFDFVVAADGIGIHPFQRIDSDDVDWLWAFTAGEWVHWKNNVSDFHYPDSATVDFGSMLVPNVDSVRTEYLINTIAKQGKV